MRTVGSLALLAVASCGGTVVEPTDVRSRITSDLGSVLHEARAAYDLTAGTLPGTVLRGYLPDLPALPKIALDPDASIAWLTDQLFTDAHYLGDGVYRFPAELVCAADADCVTRWDDAQVRIRVEDDDGLRFWIQVGVDRDEPIEITLRHTELVLTADLDAANRAFPALAALAPAFGVSADGASLAGAITADLEVLGPAHARATVSFDRPINVAIEGSRLYSDAGTVAVLELADTMTASLALGQTTVYDATTNRDLELPGATFDLSADHGSVQVDHISLGTRTTTLSVNGVIGRTIDINPNAGRSFSLTLSGDHPGEAETIEQLHANVEVAMTTNHAVLGDTAPLYDVTRLELDNWISLDATELDVIDGSFSLTTDPAQYSFVATKDQCVSMTGTTEHIVGACR